MGYDNKPHIDRAAKLKILADLKAALDEVLKDPPSYGDFYAQPRDYHDDATGWDRSELNPRTWGDGHIVDLGERIAKGRR